MNENRVGSVHRHDLDASTVDFKIGFRQDIFNGFRQCPEGCCLDSPDAKEQVGGIHSTGDFRSVALSLARLTGDRSPSRLSGFRSGSRCLSTPMRTATLLSTEQFVAHVRSDRNKACAVFNKGTHYTRCEPALLFSGLAPTTRLCETRTHPSWS